MWEVIGFGKFSVGLFLMKAQLEVVEKGLKQGPHHRVIIKRGGGLRKPLVFWGKTKLPKGNRRDAQLK